MSVQSLGHFIVRMTVDYEMLRTYSEAPDTLLAVGDEDLPLSEDLETLSTIADTCGDLTPFEIELIRTGDWNKMFEYIESNGPKPIHEDQPNYP